MSASVAPAPSGDSEKFATIDHAIASLARARHVVPTSAPAGCAGVPCSTNGTGHLSLAVELELDGGSPGVRKRVSERATSGPSGMVPELHEQPVAVAAEGHDGPDRRVLVLTHVAVQDGRGQHDRGPPGGACCCRAAGGCGRRRRRGVHPRTAAMRFRVASFGRRPMPPPMLSSMCAALVVPARATVTAGWLMTYLRKNCAQVLASNSAAHSGRGVVPTRSKSACRGRRGSTPSRRSSAPGRAAGSSPRRGGRPRRSRCR